MKKSTKAILAATGVATIAAVSASYIVSRVLVKAALSREGMKVPKVFEKKVVGGLADDPKIQAAFEARDRAKLLETESVKINSSDNVELIADIYHHQKPKRILIAMHGWRSNWQTDFGGQVSFLHDNDCTVIFPHQRGQNKSGGDYIGFGVLERKDCIDWINFVVDRFGTDIPVYLYGISMGASTVLMAAGYQLPECIKGIIADCGFTSPRAIWKYVMNNNLKISDVLAYPMANAIIKKEAQFSGDEYSTIEALKVNTRPVLFIHGAEDTFVPSTMTFENYVTCVAPKELLIVSNAGHGLSYLTDTIKYQKTVLTFFERCESKFYEQ